MRAGLLATTRRVERQGRAAERQRERENSAGAPNSRVPDLQLDLVLVNVDEARAKFHLGREGRRGGEGREEGGGRG